MSTGTQSNEHTPRTGTDKSRKHKSSSSSFFPKISRWSRTTASSVRDNFRNSIDRRQQRPFSEASRSGEDLQQYDTNDHYDHRGDDRLRSNDSLENDDVARGVNQENRAPSPLIPSQVPEDPKYQAHRDSLNLQHPQPRRTQQVCFNYFLISALAVLFLAVAHAQEINEPVNTTEILVIGYWVADRRPKTRNTTRGSTPESYRPAAPSLSKTLPPAYNPRRHSFNTENSFSQNVISNRASEHETSLSDGL